MDTDYTQMNAIGFHITGAFDKILPIEKCWLMDDLHNRIRNAIRDYAYETGMTFFNLRNKHGLLRDIVIRNSDTGEWMVLVQFHYDEPGDDEQAKALMKHIADMFPEITSLLYVDNQKFNDTYNDLEIQVFKDNDYIYEIMDGLKFKVGPKSFYQTNTEQAFRLYSVVRDLHGLPETSLSMICIPAREPLPISCPDTQSEWSALNMCLRLSKMPR